MPQLYQLLSELCCHLCSIYYTALQINNCLKITSAIKVAPMKMRCMYSGMGKGTSQAECQTAKNQAHSLISCQVTQICQLVS